MKKSLKNLTFALFIAGFSSSLHASAWSWKAWKNEDEELNFRGTSGKKGMSDYVKDGLSWWQDEDEELNFRDRLEKNPPLQQYRTMPAAPIERSTTPAQRKKYYKNTRPSYGQNFDKSVYASIDYDVMQNERNISDAEIYNSIDKWKNGQVSVFWENYRGNNVRIEMLRNNRDVKEMRLKYVQSPNMTSDPDGSISDMLNIVANQVMKRTCGRKAKQSVILYERPSVELERETAADGYKIMARGTSIKEYGFRCVY